MPAREISGRIPAGSASRHAGFVVFYVPRARIFSIFCYSGNLLKKKTLRYAIFFCLGRMEIIYEALTGEPRRTPLHPDKEGYGGKSSEKWLRAAN